MTGYLSVYSFVFKCLSGNMRGCAPFFLCLILVFALGLLPFAETVQAQPSYSSPRPELPNVTPPPNFDMSVFEFDKLQSRAMGDSLVEYDEAVRECTGYGVSAPQAEDGFFTQQKFAGFVECMDRKGYRPRGLNDFTAYDSLLTAEELDAMLEQEEALTRSSEDLSLNPPVQIRERAEEENQVRVPPQTRSGDGTKTRPVNRDRRKTRRPRQLFVPVE